MKFQSFFNPLNLPIHSANISETKDTIKHFVISLVKPDIYSAFYKPQKRTLRGRTSGKSFTLTMYGQVYKCFVLVLL